MTYQASNPPASLRTVALLCGATRRVHNSGWKISGSIVARPCKVLGPSSDAVVASFLQVLQLCRIEKNVSVHSISRRSKVSATTSPDWSSSHILLFCPTRTRSEARVFLVSCAKYRRYARSHTPHGAPRELCPSAHGKGHSSRCATPGAIRHKRQVRSTWVGALTFRGTHPALRRVA